MPNPDRPLDRFTVDLKRAIATSQACRCVRACLLTTRDRGFALTVLKRAVTDPAVSLYHFSAAGRMRWDPSRFAWQNDGPGAPDPVALVRAALELRDGGVVVLEDHLPFLRDENGDRATRAALMQALHAEAPIAPLVLVCLEPPERVGQVPSMVADQFVRVDIPYPRAADLDVLAREELAVSWHRANLLFDVEKLQAHAARLASALVGLTRSAARDALRDALVSDASDIDAAFERLQTGKTRLLSRELAMNVLDTEGAEEPIGLDALMAYLDLVREDMSVTGNGRARGILLVGPAGVGKTMLARSIGSRVRLPVVEFRISSLMNSLLGETERRFSQAYQTLEAMAPNVVFIDEIEKAFAESSERDGGTMMRVTGSLLTWLSDNPNPNFVVGTANSLRRLGEIGLTMTRSERFDACFFVDVPNEASRAAMLQRWLGESVDDPVRVAGEIAAETAKFSGADLYSAFKMARRQAKHEGRPIGTDLLRDAVDRKRSRVSALYEEFEGLRRWARANCDPAGDFEA